MWHVSSRSGVATLRTAIHLLLTLLLTSDKELFCRRLVTGDKTWIYHWVPLSKLEFMQWKDVSSKIRTVPARSGPFWPQNY